MPDSHSRLRYKLVVIPEYQLSYGLTQEQLVLEPLTMERAADLSVGELIAQIFGSGNYDRYDPDASSRTLNMALATFLNIMANQPGGENAFDGLYYNQIFAACLDTAMTWEVG